MFEGRYPRSDVWCADVRALATCWATPGADAEWSTPQCDQDCYPTEDVANNFAALRHIGPSPLGSQGSLYVEFHTGDASTDRIDWTDKPHSVEMYDGADVWQMTNLLHDARGDSASVTFAAQRLSAMLKAWISCEGSACP